MRGTVGDWLVAGVTLWGIQFQNWMILIVVMVAAYAIYVWITNR